ncbi:MAG: hypothetical protein AT713_06830 [Caldivirga sp. JCHS_4]|nr:MAG: hypothetical protein AT713_06830 [Caldivirga sp. JCHS_4]
MYVYHHHIIYLSIKYTGNINEETILHLNTIKTGQSTTQSIQSIPQIPSTSFLKAMVLGNIFKTIYYLTL